MRQQFWMVHGDGPPRVKHESEQRAIAEAERLARMHPGQAFFVLEATHMRTVDDMRRVDLRRDEIPF